MNTFILKIKLVFLPFLFIAVAIVVGYSFLNWALVIKLSLINIPEDIIHFWVPFLLPFIVVLIWLRPRIKLLHLPMGRSNVPFIYAVIASGTIITPTIIAQRYLETETGKLTPLEVISDIEKLPPTKYYSLKHFYTDKAAVSTETEFEVTGRHNENFNMRLFFVLPILDSADYSATDNCVAWYGIKYQESISNRLSDEKKEIEFQLFRRLSEADFERKDLTRFHYFDRIGNSYDHEGFNAAIRNSKMYTTTSTTVLLPVNESYEARNGEKLPWVFGSFAIGAFVWLIMIIIPSLDKKALKSFHSRKAKDESKEEVMGMLKLLSPQKGYFVTPIIMMANILVFLIMVFAGYGFSFNAGELFQWGGNFGPAVADGQWWRLATSIFLHGGFIHLFVNMVSLVLAGMFLEPIIGSKKYTIAYLLAGILASVSSIWWYDAKVSVGASGAIMGLFGVLLALLIKRSIRGLASRSLVIIFAAFIGYNLLIGFLGIGVDNAAHIGGLVSGFITGLFLSPQEEEKQ